MSPPFESTSQSPADSETIVLVDPKKCNSGKDTVKGGFAAFIAGVSEYFGNWTFDFSVINAKEGLVDVVLPFLGHVAMDAGQWFGVAVASHLIALGSSVYAAYKIGKAVKTHRQLKRSYEALINCFDVEFPPEPLAKGIKGYFQMLKQKLGEKSEKYEERLTNWFDKYGPGIAKYAIPLGIGSYFVFEGIVSGAWLSHKEGILSTEDTGTIWNTAAFTKTGSLIVAAAGYLAKGLSKDYARQVKIKINELLKNPEVVKALIQRQVPKQISIAAN